jgi:N-acyl-D-aspartate/D-glutamate deacylase
MTYDLKIAGGTIVDGTGHPRYRGDVGIKDGKVAALGRVDGEAEQVIDATGRVVCPGFVDIHTHYDAQVMWDRMLSISPWHGVTTVVIGNCGFGVAPTRPAHRDLIARTLEKVEGMSLQALRAGLGADWAFESFPEYLDALEARGSAINIGVLFGHTPLRLFAMGEDAVKRAATADEVAGMAGLVAEAMEAGALGFATSHAATHHGFDGHPVPSRMAELAEIDALVGAVAAHGGGIMQATIGRTLLHDEFEALARRHGLPVTWTALLAGMAGPGSHRRHLERTARQRAEGLRIVPQVACRPINFDFDFNEPFPFEMRPLFKPTMQTDRAGRRAIYADPAFRQAFAEDTAPGRKTPLAGWADRAVISVAPGRDDWVEQPLAKVARAEGVSPVDLALDLSLASDFAARFRFGILNTDEAEVAELLADPNCVVALSDAGAHASQLCDACYSTHLLGHWVREKGTLELEAAVARLTSEPAAVMGIAERGQLRQGWPADVVVFDPATIGAGALRRVHDLPAGADRLVSEARGIDAVIVNGSLLRQGGVDRLPAGGALPGRLLRHGRAG